MTRLTLLAVGTALAVSIATVPEERGPLPFEYDLYTFRGEEGQTRVVAAFAVSAGELHRDEEDGLNRYRFDVSFIVTDTALQTVVRTDDSVFVGTPGSLDGDHLLHTYVELDAPPSPDTQQRVIMTDASTPGVGQLYQSPFRIPDYGGDELLLSDIALGLPDVDHGWERGSAALALLPTRLFPESAFDVYYEIYNLPGDHAYATEISIRVLTGGPEDEEGAPAVRTVFTGRSAPGGDGALGELRRVESALPQGAYRLTVTVTDEDTGEVAQQSREFQVRGWRAGTTLVPALPRRTHVGSDP